MDLTLIGLRLIISWINVWCFTNRSRAYLDAHVSVYVVVVVLSSISLALLSTDFNSCPSAATPCFCKTQNCSSWRRGPEFLCRSLAFRV
jgi:hypothetical protein